VGRDEDIKGSRPKERAEKETDAERRKTSYGSGEELSTVTIGARSIGRKMRARLRGKEDQMVCREETETGRRGLRSSLPIP